MEQKLKNGFKKIKDSQRVISREVRQQSIAYILAALGFVVGLAWNDAIKSLIEFLFPLNKSNILIKFIYALLVTLVIIAATIILTKKSEEEKNQEN